MKLVIFGINEERNLIAKFPFLQPYTQQLLLYQIEMVPVPIIDENKQAHSYTHLQVEGPYIALNYETYISLKHWELRTWAYWQGATICSLITEVKQLWAQLVLRWVTV